MFKRRMCDAAPPPVCLSANIFTLAGRPVKENKYVSIFFFWLANIIGRRILAPEDELYLSTDTATLDYLKTSTTFMRLLATAPFKKRIRTYAPPKNFLEGTIERYRTPLTYSADVLFYIDIDTILLKPLGLLAAKMSEEGVYLHPEGQLSHFCYSHGFPAFMQPLCTDRMAGYSSGKFAIKGRGPATLLFHAIERTYSSVPADLAPETFYTGDQPIFNQAIYKWLLVKSTPSPLKIHTGLWKAPIISVNRLPADPAECFLIDLMGEPGDEGEHMNKIHTFYPLLIAGVFD
jgi:hypothetical protein